MRVIYLAHPLGAATKEGVQANIARAKRWIRWIYDNFKDVAVVADWLITCEVLDDHNPEHRAHGMRMNKAVIPRCDEFWMVGGRVSSGMGDELGLVNDIIGTKSDATAMRRVFDLTWLGEEPPVDVPEPVRALVA
jgi:hypothetical protein